MIKFILYLLLISILSCQGEKGDPGPTGSNGNNGNNGPAGPLGAKGDPGVGLIVKKQNIFPYGWQYNTYDITVPEITEKIITDGLVSVFIQAVDDPNTWRSLPGNFTYLPSVQSRLDFWVTIGKIRFIYYRTDLITSNPFLDYPFFPPLSQLTVKIILSKPTDGGRKNVNHYQ